MCAVSVKHTRTPSTLQSNREHGSFLKGFETKCSDTAGGLVQTEWQCPKRGKSLSKETGNGVSDSYVQDHSFLLDCVGRDQGAKEPQG